MAKVDGHMASLPVSHVPHQHAHTLLLLEAGGQSLEDANPAHRHRLVGLNLKPRVMNIKPGSF